LDHVLHIDQEVRINNGGDAVLAFEVIGDQTYINTGIIANGLAGGFGVPSLVKKLFTGENDSVFGVNAFFVLRHRWPPLI
jgi:hypothetical protein